MRWSSYRRCTPEEVPAWTIWDESDFSPKGYVVWYGGPGTKTKTWGAPFRRIVSEKNRTITYYRWVTGLRSPREGDAA